ncbi:MAG: DUF1854 domain-containing protein [Chloroherpetonaceae bacterium]|nr:DUF1854 domain-containing protein [Chthonomonadaceae bacterium]MDW8208105.1 DUF1854 domain-containing protein [Chloroherpetonaceae bacterium]
MQISDLKLFYTPGERLRLTIGNERSYPTVRPVWAAPLSHPDRYLVLLNARGEEIVMIPDPGELPPDSLAAVREELRRRYLTAYIQKVYHARVEYEATYWSAQTSRGEREFITVNLQENAIWLDANHLLLLDVDGNRFEIPDITHLDVHSQQIIRSIL